MEIGKAIEAMPSKQRCAAKYLAGFFAAMALLTFLSRAADSFTVPVVETDKISAGSLEHKVTSEGALYPVSQSAVFAPSGYRILSLNAEEGGRVSEGDTLAELDIAEMQKELDDAKANLQKLRLGAAANAVKAPAKSDEGRVSDAERAIERAEADLETIERESQLRVEMAQNEVSAARKHLRELRDMHDDDYEDEEEDEAFDLAIDEARNALRRRQQELEEADLAKETALEKAWRAIEDTESLLEQELAKLETEAETDAADKRRTALEQETAGVDINLAQQKVSQLETLLETGGIVKADKDGIVAKVNGSVGSVTSEAGLVVLSDSSAGVRFRASVGADDLKRIRRGDGASIELTGESRAVDAVIESISTTADKDGGYDVTAVLPDGNFEPGTSGKMTVIQKTVSYSMCLPNGAVRKDHSGHFVLVVREVSGVLGYQNVAAHVPVSVLERDEKRCAIEGPLERDDLIITGSGKPVSEGNRVRLDQEE